MADSTVLIVDDDSGLRMLMRHMISREGYRVLEAESGRDALVLYALHRPDLVLIDALLPDVDGINLCAQMHATNSDSVLLVITALDSSEAVDRAFNAGAADYITKPIHWPVMRRRIRQYMKARAAEQSLRETQRLNERIITAMPHILYIYDLALQRTIYANRPLYTLLGYPAENPPVGNILDAIHPDDMRLFMTHLGKFSTATDNDVFDIDYRMLDVNGHYRWIRSTDVIFSRTPDGVSWQILGIAQDISYHKQAEREQQDRSLALENLVNDRTRELSYANSLLQQEINERNRIGAELQYRLEFEKQLSTISSYFISLNDFESVQAGVEYGLAAVAHQIGADRSFIYWFDGEGLQLRLKHSWQAPGVPPRDNSPVELLTMPWLMAPMHNGDDVYMPVVDDGLRQATNVEKALSLEGVHWIIFVPMSFVNRPVGFMGIEALRPSQPPKEDILPLLRYVGEVFANAMESKRTEMALHASEEQLRRITDSMLDMIVQIEENGTIEYVSPSCWAMMGYVATVILGSSFYDLVHPDDLEHTRHSIHHIGLVEFRARHANGQYIWVEAVGNLVLRNDKPNAYVIALREITKRKQAERELDELNRLKTDFVSIAAHELRTPLTSIVGFSELLLNRDIELDKQRRYLSLILDQATSLSALIDGLLDISRLEAKRQMELKLTEVDLCDVVSRAAAPFIESTSMHTIDLSGMVACPPVLGDNSRLLQVCKNLIGNAIKYSPRGGVVRIASQVIGGYLQISIQDEGIGMTDDQMAHLFEKFYRADASNIAISGTGLGLSITKLIIELHNGKIWAQSTYGAGTTFLFTVPLAEHSLDPMSDHMTEGNHAQDTHRG